MIAKKRRWVVMGITAGFLLGSTVVDAVTATASADSVTSNVGSTTATTTGNDRVCRTTATVLEPIPSTNVKFQQGSTGPVIVTFVAEWPKPRNDEIPAGSQAAGASIFLFIDGQRVDFISNNGGVLVHEGTATSVSNGTHGFTFVTDPIPPGNHEAQIYFLDNVLGTFGTPNGTICVNNRTTVVQHN